MQICSLRNLKNNKKITNTYLDLIRDGVRILLILDAWWLKSLFSFFSINPKTQGVVIKVATNRTRGPFYWARQEHTHVLVNVPMWHVDSRFGFFRSFHRNNTFIFLETRMRSYVRRLVLTLFPLYYPSTYFTQPQILKKCQLKRKICNI